MKRRTVTTWGCFLLLFLLAPIFTTAAASKQEELIGKQTVNFNLSSTEDRLSNYGDDYYGKAFLVMTFFPAAFTPV
jgi:hypothetical protein